MLPNRPSPRAVGGLPPAPSNSNLSRYDRDPVARRYGSSEQDAHTSGGRPRQHAAGTRERSRSRSRSRARATPTPENRQLGRVASSNRGYDRPEPLKFRASDASSSSVSSSSSLLDRMRVGQGYTSSRTSLGDDEERPKHGRRPQGMSLRERRLVEREDPTSGQPVVDERMSAPEDGSSIWNKVAAAASTLTDSVSKAWQSQVTTHEGDEETAPGQESRLTRAMRAYHLEKAKDPSDLPEWLFSEHERRPVRSRFGSRREEMDGGYEESVRSPPMPQPPRSAGLRDIYAAAAASAGPLSPPGRMYGEDGGGAPSKATDRLKALRDAKRNALNPNRAVEERSMEPHVTESHEGAERSRGPARRIGLPSGVKTQDGRF